MAKTKMSKSPKKSPVKQPKSNNKIKKILQKPMVNKRKTKLPTKDDTSANKTSNIKCSECNALFDDKLIYDKHLEECHKSNDNTPSLPPNMTKESNKFQCNLCQQLFNEISLLQTHVRQLHFGENPYMCPAAASCCNNVQQFWDAKELINHTKDIENVSFSCRHCSTAPFTNKSAFIEHDRQHINHITSCTTTIHDCHDCGDSFTTLEELNIHRRSHVNSKPYNCTKCSRSFTRSEDYNIHRRLHQGMNVYECHYCERLFAHAKNLSQHIRRSHQECVDPNSMTVIEEVVERDMRQKDEQPLKMNSKPKESEPPPLVPIVENMVPLTISSQNLNEIIRKYGCFLCDLSFVKMKTLEIHCRRNHKGMYSEQQLLDIAEKASIPPPIIEEELPTFSCPVNDCHTQSFFTQSALNTHLLSVHDGQKPYKCTQCNGTFSLTKTLQKHIDTHKNARPTCKYCGLTFVQIHSMLKHQKRHEGDTIHRCTICSMPFQEQKFLARHMRTHADGKPHKCTYCDKSFAQSCDKIKHLRIHTGERPYSCDICGKTFTHLTSIKKHSFVHSQERPYQCSVCGKSFQHNSNLVVHTRTHTGERPYNCNICDKSFYASGHYNDHMRIHSGTRNYRCDICDKTFVHQSSYQKHKKVHTGEKPHHCKLCDKRFSQPGHFKEHMRIHTGEKPYRCRECDKSFRRSDALQTHMKIHRNDITVMSTKKKKPIIISSVISSSTELMTINEIPAVPDYQLSTSIIDPNAMHNQISTDNQVTLNESIAQSNEAVIVRTDELHDLIKFENSNFLNVDPTTAITVVHNNGVLDDSFNAFSYHFQL